jgi:hypothetical protein
MAWSSLNSYDTDDAFIVVAVPMVSLLCSTTVGVHVIAGELMIGVADTTPDRAI